MVEPLVYTEIVGSSNLSFRTIIRGCSSVVERLPSKQNVVGSIPIARSNLPVFGYVRSTTGKLLGSIKLRYESWPKGKM